MATLVIVGLSSACMLSELDAHEPARDTDGADDTRDREPDGQVPEPPADASGTYEITSRFDLTVTALLPETLYGPLDVLEGLRTDPAGTLFRLIEEADAPVLADLLAVMPGVLQDRLEGWINDYVESRIYEGSSATLAIDAVLIMARTVLTQFDVITELELSGAELGAPLQAAHRLRALRVQAHDQEVEVSLTSGPLPSVLEATTPATVVARANGSHGLMLGEHAFGLAYGAYAHDALEYLVSARYGAGTRGSLGAFVDCPGLAARVADKCALGVCVGHEQELAALCEQGLDLAADELRARMHELRFDALSMNSGESTLAAAPTTGEPLIVNGAWQAAIDLGMGPRPAPATFAGALLP